MDSQNSFFLIGERGDFWSVYSQRKVEKFGILHPLLPTSNTTIFLTPPPTSPAHPIFKTFIRLWLSQLYITRILKLCHHLSFHNSVIKPGKLSSKTEGRRPSLIGVVTCARIHDPPSTRHMAYPLVPKRKRKRRGAIFRRGAI